METNGLTEESIVAAVPPWVPEVRFLSRIDSTNRLAGEWAAQGAPHGALVVADYQSAGRGRLDRSWLAPAGESLLFTVILRPRTPPDRYGLINLAAAVAVCETVAGRGLQPKIKWPNDVNLPGGKVAGILSEVSGGAVCLGVGLNVNEAEFPEEIASIASSLRIAAGRRFDRLELLAGILGELDRLTIREPDPSVLTVYRRWCETLGARVSIKLADRTITGTAQDVDSSGALMLQSGETINAGDVVHLNL